MSSNLGSMVLELSANVARFQSDMGKMYQSAQDTADKITSAFERVGAVLGVGLGVGAFKEFIDGSIEAQDQALKFAQKVGISTDAVAGLSSAAKKAGLDQQELQVALTKLAVGASEAGNGVKKYAEAYSALGINVKDANGNIKAADVLFGELANKFAGYKDGTTKTADAVLLLGKAGANLIPLLNGGSDAIQRQIKLAKDLGAAIGTDAAKGAEEFKGKMIDLEMVSKGVGNQIATGLLPALNKLADASVKFFTSSTWKSWLDDIKSAAATSSPLSNFSEKSLSIISACGLSAPWSLPLPHSCSYEWRRLPPTPLPRRWGSASALALPRRSRTSAFLMPR
jgi:hypothetical protein